MTPDMDLVERDTHDPDGRISGTESPNHGLESCIEFSNDSSPSHPFEIPLMSEYPDNILADEPTLESWIPKMDASIDIDLELPEPVADPVLDIGHNPTDSCTANSCCEFSMDLDEVTATQYIKHDTLVCFGTVSNLAAMYEHQGSGKLSSSFEVKLGSCERFSSDQDVHIRGHIQGEEAQLIGSLMDEPALKLYVVCTIDAKPAPPPTVKKRAYHQLWPCTLDLTLYGPMELFDNIGNWFQTFGVYLQDPIICHLDTKYCNPQRLSSDCVDRYPLVSDVVSQMSLLSLKELPERPDFLDILSSQVDLEETAQPLTIRTALKSHQKQALTFMLNREEGWGFNHKQPDIWDIIDTSRGRVFLNTISQVCQPEEPPGFSGGIIADPMGLGKTLTMIALAATDLEVTQPVTVEFQQYIDTDKQEVPSTLVIVPPPLLDAWEEQLFEHVIEGALVCRRYHGKNRAAAAGEFDTANIVLTTYHTVSSEWKASQDVGQDVGKSPLFTVRWRRIILDEAHYIRNVNARLARAVCDLDSASRWAVTGTPIQNRLGDLASLLKFIRAHPYTDPKHFDADFSRPWKSGGDEEAVKRLKRLSACLLLRRPKGSISIPPRRDLVYAVEFTLEEKAVYEEIKNQTLDNMDEALGTHPGSSRPNVYVNFLQRIESLRLFSNLGLHYHSRHEKQLPHYSSSDEWKHIAQRTFNSQRQIASVTCSQCSSALVLTESFLDDSAHPTENPQFTACMKYVCVECVGKLTRLGCGFDCGHVPVCHTAPVSTSTSALEEVESLINMPQLQKAPLALPSKIKALIKDIENVSSDVKCIVFSTWRLTLDLIKVGLDQAGISSIRFDGKVPQKDRQSVVNTFRSDPSVRVMLLTLSCGAVGLNLTVASRAYLMEPHWNPTLEEQSLARVHRLGQTREVETIRFYVRDSFEEQVMIVQETKKQLAGVLLSPHDNEYSENNLRTLEKLRSLL